MFDGHYKFSFQDDYYYPVNDFTPARLNREHKYPDVEKGLDSYTSNWEIVDESNERSRGSDKLYLVDDTYYVHCSRTGMEASGNIIRFSENSPDDLRFSVLSSVFEAILNRKFGKIKEGGETRKKGLQISSPRAFVLQNNLSSEELEEYYEKAADIVFELTGKYNQTETCDGLKTISDWYHKEMEELYQEFVHSDK